METLFIYLLVGVFAGLIAGLFGVGGGLIIVPVLVYVFTQMQFDTAIMVHMAVGTSLATMLLTSVASVRAHHRHRGVRWPVFWQLAPGIVLGALLGALLADAMPTVVLRRFFAIFEWLVAAQLLLGARPRATRTLPGPAGMFGAGGIIGTVSAIVGIGGGSMTVPFLVWCNVAVREAVAISSACGLPIAVAGTAGFIVTGWDHASLPAQSLGYVYLPAFLGIVAASVLFAPLGAWLAHRLPGETLKRVFGVFLLLLGVYMFMSA